MNGLAPRAAIAAGLVAAVVCGLAWFALADLVLDRGGEPTSLDSSVLTFMLAHRGPVLTGALIAITYAGGTVAMTVVAIASAGRLALRRDWWDSGLVAVVGIGASILVPATKSVVGRRRPPPVDQLVTQTNQAFPSGHALGSITVIGAVAAVALRHSQRLATRVAVRCAAALSVVAIGVSRLYLGVHWLTDVLGGWLLGGAWLLLCLSTHRLLTLRLDPGATITPRA